MEIDPVCLLQRCILVARDSSRIIIIMRALRGIRITTTTEMDGSFVVDKMKEKRNANVVVDELPASIH